MILHDFQTNENQLENNSIDRQNKRESKIMQISKFQIKTGSRFRSLELRVLISSTSQSMPSTISLIEMAVSRPLESFSSNLDG